MDAESDSRTRHAEVDSIIGELSVSRHKYGFSGTLRHRRLIRGLGDVTAELDLVHMVLDPPPPASAGMAIQTQNHRHAKSAILASLAVICRRLSDISSMAMQADDRTGIVIRRLTEWIIQELTKIMDLAKQKLVFKDWSLSINAGLPFGVSFSITMDFS